jgi:hypothetical protein
MYLILELTAKRSTSCCGVVYVISMKGIASRWCLRQNAAQTPASWCTNPGYEIVLTTHIGLCGSVGRPKQGLMQVAMPLDVAGRPRYSLAMDSDVHSKSSNISACGHVYLSWRCGIASGQLYVGFGVVPTLHVACTHAPQPEDHGWRAPYGMPVSALWQPKPVWGPPTTRKVPCSRF